MKLGLISDTHDRLDPEVARLFSGVQHILHAGDVCRPTLIDELESIAPVTVVRGNNDSFVGWREVEVVEFVGFRFLIQHIVTPQRWTPELRQRLVHIRPNVVIFGHSHRPFCEVIERVLFLNPGSAGAPRFGVPCSVCILDLEAGSSRPEFVTLMS